MVFHSTSCCNIYFIPNFILLLLLLPRPTLALPADDFQLFAVIFFVLLSAGLVISVAFASALYFFLWYGRRKKEGEEPAAQQYSTIAHKNAGGQQRWWPPTASSQRRNMNMTMTVHGNPASIWTTQAKTQPPYPTSPEDDEVLNHPKDPSLRERMSDMFSNFAKTIQESWRRLVISLSGRKEPPSTIFPSTSPAPSYISAQSPELLSTLWASPPPPPPQSKQPKSILKKPRIRWPNGATFGSREQHQRPAAPQQQRPIVIPVQHERGGNGSRGMLMRPREPPPIQQWRWNPGLGENPYDRVIEDRLEREESCVRGKLVAVERLTRTTTTTKMLNGGRAAAIGLARTFI